MKKLVKILFTIIMFIFVITSVKAKICKGELNVPSSGGHKTGNGSRIEQVPLTGPVASQVGITTKREIKKVDNDKLNQDPPRKIKLHGRSYTFLFSDQLSWKFAKSLNRKIAGALGGTWAYMRDDTDVNNEENKQSDKGGKAEGSEEGKDVTVEDLQEEVGNITETMIDLERLVDEINKEKVQVLLEEDLTRMRKEIERLNDRIEESSNVFGTNSVIDHMNAIRQEQGKF